MIFQGHLYRYLGARYVISMMPAKRKQQFHDQLTVEIATANSLDQTRVRLIVRSGRGRGEPRRIRKLSNLKIDLAETQARGSALSLEGAIENRARLEDYVGLKNSR